MTRKKEMSVRLSIIIVSYNTCDLLKASVASIQSCLPADYSYEIHVVDNSSKDGSAEWLKERFHNGTNRFAYCLSQNLGFAAANMVAVSQSGGRNLLFLNSDAFLTDDSLPKAVEYLESNRDVFGLGCKLIGEKGTPGISFGRFPTLRLILWEMITFRFGKMRAVVPEGATNLREIDYPCGAFFLVKHDLFRELGGFDERFFMYFEEADLAKRAWVAGYRIVYFPQTTVKHIHGASCEEAARWKQVERFYRSWSQYSRIHHSRFHGTIMKFILAGRLLFRSGAALLAARFESAKSSRREAGTLWQAWV